MAFIKSIEINQFRGIQKLTVSDFSDINLVVGDNNSGKTTFLEAIQLLFAKSQLSSIKNVINQRTVLNLNNSSFYTSFIKMFNMVDIGERAGSGIPNIFTVWNKQGWPAPRIVESYEPERITLSLQIEGSDDKSSDNDKKVAIKSSDKTTKTKSQIQKQAVVAYLTEKITAKTTEIAELLGVKDARARRLLAEMVSEGTIVTEGENRNRVYKLKA